MKKIVYLSVLLLVFLSQTSFTIKTNLFRDEENRKKITQSILDNLIAEQYQESTKYFHATLKKNLPVEKIAEVWKEMTSVNGAFEKVLSVSTATDKGFNQVKMRCHFKEENLTLETTFTEDDKVIAIFFKP